MELNDFSSVFELLTAYNFVNALGKNSEIWKILDLTAPINTRIVDYQTSLSDEINKVINHHVAKKVPAEKLSPEIHEQLSKFYRLRDGVIDVQKRENNHTKQVANVYLLCGIFSFMILLMSPFVIDYHKLNTLSLIVLSMVVFFPAFLFCEKGKTKLWIKNLVIGLLLFFAAYLVTSKMFHYSYFKRGDQFYLLWFFMIILGLIFVLLRRYITDRKFFKGIFAFTFILLPFFPRTQFGFSLFYYNGHHEIYFNLLVISVIILCGAAFIYDILFQGFLSIRLQKINREFRTVGELFQGGVSKSGSDLEPFNL